MKSQIWTQKMAENEVKTEWTGGQIENSKLVYLNSTILII